MIHVSEYYNSLEHRRREAKKSDDRIYISINYPNVHNYLNELAFMPLHKKLGIMQIMFSKGIQVVL